MKTQDCLRIEQELIDRAKDQAKKERTSKSSIYRKALVQYLEKVEIQYVVK